MSHVIFQVDPTSDIESTMLHKMQDGCKLLSKIFQDEEFARWVYKFQWQTNDGQTFQRFYHSCGRNNEQVYQSLLFGKRWDDITESNEAAVFKVVPCNTPEAYAKYSRLEVVTVYMMIFERNPPEHPSSRHQQQ